MIDLRNHKKIDLKMAKCLKEDVTYLVKDEISEKNLIVKFIGHYNDSDDVYLLSEFKKLFLLSAEPEIGTVYYLATSQINGADRNCYVMDYINGKTIGKIINENDVLSFDFILSIIKQLALGLEKSHNYEISHGDLHEENIIVDNLGFLKIIDFAFWGNLIDFYKNVTFDIECFNNIVKLLVNKCQDYELGRLKMITQLFQSIKSFKDLQHHINLIEEISFDYNLLDDQGREIISLIINEIPFEINLSLCLSEKNVPIPENPDFEQTTEEKMYMEKENSPTGTKIIYSDQRRARIDNHIQNVFIKKLHQLKQLGIIDWRVWVSDSGNKFIGPYEYNFEIFLTPKLVKWKKVNATVNFLENVEGKSLIEVLIN